MSDSDPTFNARVDALIDLCNAQTAKQPTPILVATSAAFATARFAVWATASKTLTVAELQERRQGSIQAYTEGFRQMLEQHYDEMIDNYDRYLNRQPGAVTRAVD